MIRRTAALAGLCWLAGVPPTAAALSAVAYVRPTAKGSGPAVHGTVSFMEVPGGLQVSARLVNVPPGKHGFHIHEFGLCEDEGKAAGEHYNPAGARHGLVTRDGPAAAHAGDLGNIEAGSEGVAVLEAVLPGVSLSAGEYPLAGRAVILHQNADDFGQPSGNAGGRIACGQIVLSGP